MGARHCHERGFTLIEAMVGVVIIGILAIATVPNLRSYRESQRMSAACDRIAAACREARSQARAQNHNIIVSYDVGANQFTVIQDANDNGVADGDETVDTWPLPDGVTLGSTTFTNNQLVFNGRGLAVNGGSVTVNGHPHVDPLRVRISSGTGQVKILPVSPSS
jgi:type IV fimbrial biogenesis protein FimT